MRAWTWAFLLATAGCGLFDKDEGGDDQPAQDAGIPGPFKVTANVTGLSGTGLVLEFKSSTMVSRDVAADGVVDFGEFAQGTMFDVVPTAQPSGVTCHSAAPASPLNADAVIAVTCAAPDLLITEVGPVYAGGWLEIVNQASGARDLAQYKLRTSGGRAALGKGDVSTIPPRCADEDQALVLVHELGHNLSLAHGGDAEVNYKPNYFSIMNYLYRQGLSTVGKRRVTATSFTSRRTASRSRVSSRIP